jgi:hypothetical protein
VADWDCPTNPGLYSDFSTNAGNYVDLPTNTTMIFSVGDNGRIYPPPPHYSNPATPSQLDRYTFYVASAPSGIFNIPLNAFLGPTIVTAYNSTSNPAPLGYGAAPIPTGVGKEACPSSPIPQGFHWVKVWLFRADLPARNYLTSTTLAEAGQFYCNRQWTVGAYAGTNVFTDCGAGNASATAILPSSSSNVLADRVVANLVTGTNQNGSCINIYNPSGNSCGANGAAVNADDDVLLTGAGCTTDQAGTAQISASFSNYGLGTDFWQYLDACSTSDPDYVGLCKNNTSGKGGVPADTAPTLAAVPGDAPQYDFVFTVSPDISWTSAASGLAINSGDMEAGTGNANYFTPYRYKSATDCALQTPSPANGGTNTCTVSTNADIIEPYGLKLHDVGTNGDPPADDPNRAGVYPMCAIQPN